jgi:polyphosphate kinase
MTGRERHVVALATTPKGGVVRNNGLVSTDGTSHRPQRPRRSTTTPKATSPREDGSTASPRTRRNPESTANQARVPAAPPAATLAAATTGLPDDRYLNRELSWLDFNSRVLAIAEDPSQPVLERAKFVAIFASNLDEFYMVRVAGLKRREETGLSVRSADGLSPHEQLARISARNQDLVDKLGRVYLDDLRPQLDANGIRILTWSELPAAARNQLAKYFDDHVFPVLTPLAVDPAHPFPYISGLSLNLAVTVTDPDAGVRRFARVKVPNNVPRLVRVETEPDSVEANFVPLEEVIAAHLDRLFPSMEVSEHHIFRVTRNADLEVEEDRDEDLLQAMERELAQRRFGPPVRLEITHSMTDTMLELLLRELGVDRHDVVVVPGLLDLSCLFQLDRLQRPDLKDSPMVPATHPAFAEGHASQNIFAMLRTEDVLVHHPYQSFSTSVQRFIEQAAADPQVLAIKQTLYRTSGDSPIVNALIDAAEAGKQVVALVELKARFDEQANIQWARTLERSGVHVVYGLVGLKTHCKTALVVRQEGSAIRRYCHVGTGNYNPKTARTYEDLGLLTAAPEVGADLTDLFNVLTGYARHGKYRRILVSPQGIRNGIVERIDGEAEHARQGRPCGIRMKLNSLVDEQIIDALYRASIAGVPVRIVVRGICALKAGAEGLSENIEVRSILGRFLEHSRVFHFAGANERWIGSADMMHRNLDRRIETLVRVTDPKLTAQLDRMLESALHPSTRCWVLNAKGDWEASPHSGEQVWDHQTEMLRQLGAKM